MRKNLKTEKDLTEVDLSRYGLEAVTPVKKVRVGTATIQSRPPSLARLVPDLESDKKMKR